MITYKYTIFNDTFRIYLYNELSDRGFIGYNRENIDLKISDRYTEFNVNITDNLWENRDRKTILYNPTKNTMGELACFVYSILNGRKYIEVKRLVTITDILC